MPFPQQECPEGLQYEAGSLQAVTLPVNVGDAQTKEPEMRMTEVMALLAFLFLRGLRSRSWQFVLRRVGHPCRVEGSMARTSQTSRRNA